MDILTKIKNARVLVVGDTMLDHYLWGDVYRISPEAPVPVVHANRDTYTAGGAANVAINLANLGVSTALLGHLGNDHAGQQLHQILADKGIRVVPLPGQGDAPTIIKTRVIIRSQQLCRIDREASPEQYRVPFNDEFESSLHQLLDTVDAVIISDYAKGVISQELVSGILAYSASRPAFLVAVDPKPSRKLSFDGASLITPNRTEALELAGLSLPHPDDPYPLAEVCAAIHEKYHPKLLIITLGAEGMAICRDGQVLEHLPTEAREVFDVSGAGDTVIATLTAALVSGADPHRAAWLANGAAGCVVAHMGTAPILLAELDSWMTRHSAE